MWKRPLQDKSAYVRAPHLAFTCGCFTCNCDWCDVNHKKSTDRMAVRFDVKLCDRSGVLMRPIARPWEWSGEGVLEQQLLSFLENSGPFEPDVRFFPYIPIETVANNFLQSYKGSTTLQDVKRNCSLIFASQTQPNAQLFARDPLHTSFAWLPSDQMRFSSQTNSCVRNVVQHSYYCQCDLTVAYDRVRILTCSDNFDCATTAIHRKTPCECTYNTAEKCCRRSWIARRSIVKGTLVNY